MATKFLEPGGDADFLVGTTNGFWTTVTATIASDFVHGSHVKSIQYVPSSSNSVTSKTGILNDTGSRISFYVYWNAIPNTSISTFFQVRDSAAAAVLSLQITTVGVLRLLGSGLLGTGITFSPSKWYRLSIAYTISSTTINRIEVFVDGVSTISITNGTLSRTGSDRFTIFSGNSDPAFDMRTSDHYADDSSSLLDTGNIWVTAKRPNANGTANNFNTQIGAGGSGYGSGHSPQVNERALSTTNGWSKVGAGSAVTEEYNIEANNVGDINIAGAIIIDYIGWVSASALAAETINVIVNGVNFSQALTTTATMYTKAAGSTTYPAGTGTDIGAQTDTALTTTSLYECGIVVAYIPSSGNKNLPLMGTGT